jgi:hypothetical protein
MGTRPLTQRLYDKTKLDISEFDNQLAAWDIKQRKIGLAFGGSTAATFWQQSQTHLQSKIAEYFEWIEKESSVVNPSSGANLTFESRLPNPHAQMSNSKSSTRINKLLVVLEIPTFARTSAASGCKCRNRTTSLRRESIDQCVGAVVTYSRRVRKRTIEKIVCLRG